MYDRSKKLLIFLVLLMTCEITALGVLFGVPRAGLVGALPIFRYLSQAFTLCRNERAGPWQIHVR